MKGKVYGLNPNMNQTEMREAVREERFIELLFEQKRLWDMRRWMIYDKLMNGQGECQYSRFQIFGSLSLKGFRQWLYGNNSRFSIRLY